jgi:hypothetical protein
MKKLLDGIGVMAEEGSYESTLYNSDLKPIEFDGFRQKAKLNADLIRQSHSPSDRFQLLNQTDIQKMELLVEDHRINKRKVGSI